MARSPANILITGGAGFIGCNLIRYLLHATTFSGRIVNVDRLTYAGNLDNLEDVAEQLGQRRYVFERADICDQGKMSELLSRYDIDTVVHLAAESHVDRSVLGARQFIDTNVVGTFTLMEAARAYWGRRTDVLFHHVSTDEVYGSLGPTGSFNENTPYDPQSPYSASKAASDHIVRAAFNTYGVPVTITNCSNNYGPYQFPEKLVPLMIRNAVAGEPLPIYGDGRQVRDWLYVSDHCSALWRVIQSGAAGETYLVGGESECSNIDLVRQLCTQLAAATGTAVQDYLRLIEHVADRPGHDQRYAVDCAKIKGQLGWRQSVDLATGLAHTVDWYLQHSAWLERVQTGGYRSWLQTNYGSRETQHRAAK